MTVTDHGISKRFFGMDDMPTYLREDLEQQISESQMPMSSRVRFIWEPTEPPVNDHITELRIDVDVQAKNDFSLQNGYINTPPEKQIQYRFRGIGGGDGFSNCPAEEMPPLPLRIISDFMPGTPEMTGFLNGVLRFYPARCLMCSQTFFEIVSQYDPGLPETCWYKVIISSRDVEDVGEMYLFDPPFRTDLIDWDRSAIKWRYREKSALWDEHWQASVWKPQFKSIEKFSVASIAKGGPWAISRKLHAQLKAAGVLGLEDARGRGKEMFAV